MEMAIYKTGETGIQTTVHNGRCDFTAYKSGTGENFTVDEYLKVLGDGWVCIPLDDAVEACQRAQIAKYVGPWEEITQDEWEYALEVLPPQKWQTVDGVNLFRMSEYMTGLITSHYAAIKDSNGAKRYFTAYRMATDKYSDLAEQVRAAAN